VEGVIRIEDVEAFGVELAASLEDLWGEFARDFEFRFGMAGLITDENVTWVLRDEKVI
jgi:hypothetical protein